MLIFLIIFLQIKVRRVQDSSRRLRDYLVDYHYITMGQYFLHLQQYDYYYLHPYHHDLLISFVIAKEPYDFHSNLD
jgi:hypothetical protein